MLKTLGAGLLALVLLAAVYLAIWPVPIKAEAWQAPADPGYQGPHAVNNKLTGLTLVSLGNEAGPEHVALGPDGKLYATVASGRILRMNPDGTGQETYATTGGRVLGFDFDAAGNLVAADALKGLLSISPKGGVTVLTDKVSGNAILYADAVVVAETGKYRIWKVAVTASDLDARQASPQAQVLIDNIPGYPDNLMRGQEGRIWVGLSGPRSAKVDDMAGKPFLREVTLRLPHALWPLPKPYGHVFAFDEAGHVVADLQDPSGAYPQTTGVTETAERLYVQNLHNGVLGWLPTSKAH